MIPDTEILDEVTVVAYGTKRKQDLVGSISSVKNEIISNSQATSVSNALEGAVAGLQVVSSSGQPGQDANIVLRGIGSISASNNALIVVDGVPFNGKLSDINPTDIASVNVSKDAVSNSLYGSRAAGGVVMITTKTGRKDKVAINFNGSWGVAQRAYKDYDMATDPGEFYRLSWYGLRNTYWAAGNSIEESNLAASQDLLGELGNYNAYIIPQGEYLVTPDGKLNPNARPRYNDSFADALFDNAFRQEYNVSASGGNDRTDYYVSMGFLDNDSYVLGSSYERFTARANVNSQLKSWLKVGTNVGYSKATQNGVQENAGAASNPFEVARSWAPIFPVHAYDAEGNMKYYEDGSPMYDAGNGETDGTSKRPTATNQNVIANMKEDIRETVYNNLTSRSYLEISFLKNFKFTANYSYDFTNSSQTVFYTPLIGDGQSFGGRGTKGSYNTTTTNFNQILAYSNVFGDNHHLSAKIGHEYYKYEYQYLAGQKTNFFNPNNPELDNGGQMQYINSYTANHNIEGYFGMADYDYSNKYYLSAAFRRDGTSRFLDRWGNFWSVGAAWRISNEAFMEKITPINIFKIRASYGLSGWDGNLSHELWRQSYGYAAGYNFGENAGSVSGGSEGNLPVVGLVAEKSQKATFGFDLSALNNRLNATVEGFYEKRSDILVSGANSTSGIIGVTVGQVNEGIYKYRGFDASLNWNDKAGDFHYSIGATMSYLNSEVVNVNQAYQEYDYLYTKGNRVGQMYGLEAIGFFNSQQEINNSPQQTFSGIAPGDVKYKDQNGDNRIDEKDVVKMFGSSLPRFYFGFNLNFSYKRFELSADFQGMTGVTVSLLDSPLYRPLVNNGNISNTFLNEEVYWTPENKAKATMPRLTTQENQNNYRASSLWYRDGSFLKLRNLLVAYTFPKSQTRFADLQVFVQGTNLFSLDNIHFADPEQLGIAYPSARSYWAGVKLNF